jgi:hypothetical protein
VVGIGSNRLARGMVARVAVYGFTPALRRDGFSDEPDGGHAHRETLVFSLAAAATQRTCPRNV